MEKSETHKTENIQGKVDWVQVIFHQISWQDVFTKLLHIHLDCIDCQPNSTSKKLFVFFSYGSLLFI